MKKGNRKSKAIKLTRNGDKLNIERDELGEVWISTENSLGDRSWFCLNDKQLKKVIGFLNQK